MIGPLVLFVLHETLVTSGDVAEQVLYDTVKAELSTDIDQTLQHHETDLGFVQRACIDAGVSHVDEKACSRRILHRYAERYAGMRKSIMTDIAVFAGARETVSLLNESGAYISVITPRSAAVALVKLSATRFTRELDMEIGGFGNDASLMEELVSIARSRTEKLRDITFADQDVWLVGASVDTITMAKSLDVRALAVAIGQANMHELRDANADAVFSDYGDPDAIIRAITSA